MTRRHLTFRCEGSTLVGTLDEPLAGTFDEAITTGLLLVSGGNEIRAGAWNSQALLADRIASEGFPVFRFDRRGIGDSDGPNGGFTSSGPDIAAALAAFRQACPGLTRIVGFGNCDAASALMLAGGAGLDGLVLGNPWTIEANAEAPAPSAIRQHYRQRLADSSAIRRLLTGQVSLGKLVGSLRDALRPAPPAEPNSLASRMAAGISDYPGPVTFLLAGRDRTGQAFRAAWRKGDPRIRTCPEATHSFVEAVPREWLVAQILEALRA